MQLLVYLLAYPFLWLISILPFRLFYLFSDFIYVLVFHVVGYRKEVVYNNLKLVFPKKTEEEILKIRKGFYHHMCDTFLEMVKTMSLSKKEAFRRFKITNIEVLQDISKNKSVLVVCSHYANWEWLISTNNHVDAKGYGVYQKVGNKHFDRLIKKIRAKWNTELISQRETVKTVVGNARNGVLAVYGMVSDQSPRVTKNQYWREFMGVKVPVFNGPENLAKKLDLAVLFMKVSKVKRGYYSAEIIPITLSGKDTEKNEITDEFFRLTENQIKERPEHYLWSHRRWKHRDKVPKEYQ
ncbi:lysophospholipid acyltransferase family protein [Arenibacter sp. 6A1]|uniref:lysophospholipid acyltransferase family protein n=1 Tax=Arenibacter sp. 6A1 TaxID=2720391 RepID=UPI001447E2F3|nr:lysophospholipid acyltransferase family protein [Arenibacter sp. 6A1]NKI25108.1 lysophospholipid acyltransferase family protein [Arenibacter sp. 6A1]